MCSLGCSLANPPLSHDGTEWPRDEAGEPLAKGTHAGLRGDWDFLAKRCMLPSPSHTFCCWWCTTQTKDTLEDRNGDAMTSDDFFKWCEDIAAHDICALFSLPGAAMSMFLTTLVDWMHLVELGVRQDLVGSICWECLRRPGTLPGGSIPLRLNALNDWLKTLYSEHKPVIPVQRLTKGMVKSEGGQPKLKCKTSECRGPQPWAVQLAKLLLTSRGDISGSRRRVQMPLWLVSLKPRAEGPLASHNAGLPLFFATGFAFARGIELDEGLPGAGCTFSAILLCFTTPFHNRVY